MSDPDALTLIGANNMGARQNYDRYVELIKWVKEKHQ